MTDRLGPVFQSCACGRHSYTYLEWKRLHCPGLMIIESGHTIELRDCICGSTMGAVLLPVPLHIHEELETGRGKDAA